MEYVLLDIYWNRVFDGKEMDYRVRQLAAIHIDDKLHTVSTFHRLDSRDSKTAKQITYTQEICDDIIMDFESIWEEFKQWLPKDAVLIVWDTEIEHMIQRYNKIFWKKPIKARFVDLQALQEAMFPTHEDKKSLRDVMTTLGLTCTRTHMISVLYFVQCMLRFYRKLWREGRKYLEQEEWEDLLLGGEFSELQRINSFSEILLKSVQTECRSMVMDFCKEKQYQFHIKGTSYEIDANQAVWKFDLMNAGADLSYIPKKYVRVPHYDMQVKIQERNVVKILPEIFVRINYTEDRLKYGVGSDDVEEVLNRLCNLKYS